MNIRRLWWAWLVGAVLVGCGTLVPVDPNPQPKPKPSPVDPNPNPQPQPAVTVVPYATTHAIQTGMTRDEVKALMVVVPIFDTKQDDGTRIARWATVNSVGDAMFVDVQFGAQDDKVVEGRPALIPRPT